MFLSKIQIKNLLTKELSKHAISKSRKGRICSFSSTGLKFDDKQDGFVRVSYFDSNATHNNREAVEMRRAREIEKAKTCLLAAGFEFDGLDGYRKERAK
jgi:hypothetical protein